MFKPMLSSINEAGGGIKFADGGISPSNLNTMMSKMSSTNSANVNIGSSSPVNVNVNVNGAISIDGKDFKKGQTITTQPDFDTIEAAGKAGKIKQGEHFAMGVGGGGLKETEKESAKKVMADITALSKEDQAKIKKFISSRSKKQSLKEYEHHYEVRNGQCRRYNDEGEYTVVAMHYCR
jgi:hypothetical protein